MNNLKVLFLLSFLLFTLNSAFAETKLTYPQRQAVQRQQSTLKEVEKKVEVGVAEADKKYLAQKLDNVIADLTKNNCPDDNEQIVNMKARVKAAREKLTPSGVVEEKKADETKTVEKKVEVAKTEEVKQEQKAPEPEKAKEPEKAPTVVLSYQHRQAMDRQKRNLSELEKMVGDLNEKEPSIKYYPYKVEEGLGFNKKIESIISDLTKAGCPKEHPQVADFYNRIEKAKTTIADLEVKLKPKFELFDKYTNIANYPDYNNDMEQLKRLFKKYNNSEKFYTNKTRADELINGYKDDATFFNALPKKYAPLINFKTNYGEKLMTSMKSIQKHMQSFYDAKKAYGEALPDEINSQLNSAKTMAKDAFDNKKPAFFGGGVLQWMDKAKENIDMLEAIVGADDAKAKSVKSAYEKQKQEIAVMEKSMEELILAESKLPDDIYSGSDKESIRKQVLDAWKKEYPNDEIIKIVFSKDGWDRTNKWTYNNSEWVQTNKSVFVCLVVVKTDDKIATTYPAYLNKDHMNNDRIKMGVQTKASGYVHRRVLIANIK